MANRYYSEFPERRIDKAPAASVPKRGGKSASGLPKDSDPGYAGLPQQRKGGSMNRVTKFPDIKVAVKEAYDGTDTDVTRYSR